MTVHPGGKTLPQSGKVASATAAAGPAAAGNSELQNQVTLLNKFLNDSGKPDEFRVDPASNDKLIQQINPATGEVVGEFSASEFAALARSLGLSGVLVNKRV
ncbi:MAG TPA: flagellar protein FlaG [Steroidobacteraceae bacterium]|nr:flagellar protein FlaG [Steroidobacteraceae bacterium]